MGECVDAILKLWENVMEVVVKKDKVNTYTMTNIRRKTKKKTDKDKRGGGVSICLIDV